MATHGTSRLLYGLSISVCDQKDSSAGEIIRPPGTDVLWLRRMLASDPGGEHTVLAETRGDGIWIRHRFASGNRCCLFDVSPDGRVVISSALPSMEQANIEELFSETVMRTVLCQLGLVSFHAAALALHDRSILLMGSKGAGKSTFAAALQQHGWVLMADDLVRLRIRNGLWEAVPGMRRTKLRMDSMHALGYQASHARPRWSGDLSREAAGALLDEKLLFGTADTITTEGVPIRGIFALQPRGPSTAALSAIELSVPEKIRSLAQHLTADPLGRHQATAPDAGAAMSGLLTQSAIVKLVVPDNLSALSRSAATLESLLTA